MTTAYWCVLIALFLPYLSTVTAKAVSGGFSPKHNHDPRALLNSLTGLGRRANNAQLNSFEVTPAFSAAVIIAHAMAFVASRVLYFICYLADWAPVRSLVWFVNMGLIISLFVVSA